MAVQGGGSRGVVEPGARPAGWGLAAALVLFALALLLARLGGPPPARPASALATEFSAGRAQAVLRDLLGDGGLLLLDEGEEMQRLGAQAFQRHSPAMAEVGAVVNLEARGTAGPSLLFETSGPDAWMAGGFAARATHPFANSVFSTIYEYTPNDTDLTVFKRLGMPGLNFAFIQNPSQYHSPLDNLADVSAASLQHHGENALAAVRGLAEGDLAKPPRGKAVYFDLFHSTVVRCPAGLSPLLGLLALALVLGAAFLLRRRGLPVWGADFMLGFGAPLSALLLLLVLGIVFQILIAPAFPSLWPANPGPAIAAFWLLALGGGLWLAGLMGRP